jgi:NAD(P)-dependent dehydrogenase (short-subunit alcohol dehydrogenase family)
VRAERRRTIALTGASSGIGAAAARALVADGHRVVVIGRDPDRTAQLADQLGMPRYVTDLDHLDAVRTLAADLRRDEPDLDTLVNNAGGLVSHRSSTRDGFETTLQRDVIAPFVLANDLAETLRANDGRMVVTASLAHRFGHVRLHDLDLARRPWFGGWPAYGTAKLEAVLLTRQWAERTGVPAYSFHPGIVATGFAADSVSKRFLSAVSGGDLGVSPQAGAVPLVRLAGDDVVEERPGTYFDGLNPGALSREARDDRLGAALWDHLASVVPGWA